MEMKKFYRPCEKISVNSTTVIKNDIVERLEKQPLIFLQYTINTVIYQAPSEDAALEQLERVTEKWEKDYPNAMKSWYKNWDVISPIFKFSADVRKVIYTTNAIESLNSGYRRLNKQRSVFPSDTALLKALYLATHEIAKKWTMPLRNWGIVLGEHGNEKVLSAL